MPRPTRSGVRGLSKQTLFFDASGRKLSATAAAQLRAQGQPIVTEERYTIDLRWIDPKTGKPARHTERLPAKLSAAAARTRALEILNAANAGKFEKNPLAAKRLGAALDEYLVWAKTNRPNTYKTRESLANILREYFGKDCRLDELSAFNVERYKRDRANGTDKRAPVQPGTINRSVIMLRHLFKLGVQWGWISSEQAAGPRSVRLLKEPPGRVRYLTPDEEGKLFGALGKRVRPIVEAADLSGMRRAEVVFLRKSAVDLVHRQITLTRTKSNKVRRIPINDALAVVLARAMESSTSEYVFTSRLGRPFSPHAVSRAFQRAVRKAGISDLRLHDIRHDFATKVRRRGAGIDAIKELLGHSDITTTMRYAHVEADLLRKAVADLPAPVAVPLPDGQNGANGKGQKLKAVP